MFTLRHTINGIAQLEIIYPDWDDALRKANELWGQRNEMARMLQIPPAHCEMTFEIASDDGALHNHHDILQEIRRRPELCEPPRRR
jgi:hypothetical protein